jgi:hypothetical protein
MDKWLHKQPVTNIIGKLLMKHLKKIFTALILGFFAFAPPGTLILIAIFTLGLLVKLGLFWELLRVRFCWEFTDLFIEIS